MNAAIPSPMRVTKVTRQSADTVTLTLAAEACAGFQAGQFHMLYVPAVGEVPISSSGDPANTDSLEYTIRAVGAVTHALCQSKRGGTIGVRGPFGHGWPLDLAVGSDVLIVAGGLGIAPLRPLVLEVLRRRSEINRAWLLVGARTPEDLIFRDDLKRWFDSGQLDVIATVDRAPVGWKGHVGVVPTFLDAIALSPPQTHVYVCGPEVMMRATVRVLVRAGVPDAQIHLSMERNMKCAVGHCGHCMLGPAFVCKDGPVLPYERLRTLFWIPES